MSSASSNIAGRDFQNGIRDGLLERNPPRNLTLVEENRIITKFSQNIGDIDLVVLVHNECHLKDLFSPSASIGENLHIPASTTLNIEVTTGRGETVSAIQKGKSLSHLEKKVGFYNTLVSDGMMDPNNTVVLYIFNGDQPSLVQQNFCKLLPRFRGTTIHFPRAAVARWQADEGRLKESRRAEEESRRAEEESRRAEEESRRAEAAEKEIVRLEELRAEESRRAEEKARRAEEEIELLRAQLTELRMSS
jgi:hypothetical protein